MNGYEEQYHRVKRWYAKLEELSPIADSDFYQDVLYAFFQNSHHLKDWIEKDKRLVGKLPWGKVDEVINASDCLRLAADICNASKHVECTRRPRSFENPRIGSSRVISLGSESELVFVVHTDKRQESAFNLAAECMEEWEFFIESVIEPLLAS